MHTNKRRQIKDAKGSLRLRLETAGLRVSHVREAILSFLARGHGPYTIDAIHRGIRGVSCNLTTVYRNLASLESAGLIRSVHLLDRQVRFEIEIPGHSHHHLICRTCQKVEAFEAPPRTDLEQIARDHGFAQVSPWLEIFGTCRACR
jgi:Fur family ferric uptake transcriptional regulator